MWKEEYFKLENGNKFRLFYFEEDQAYSAASDYSHKGIYRYTVWTELIHRKPLISKYFLNKQVSNSLHCWTLCRDIETTEWTKDILKFLD